MATSSPFSTTVHPLPFPADSCAYEIGLPSAKNALVFIGGLGDGPHSVPYPRLISKRLEAVPELSYSVFEVRMRSSFQGFGFSNLKTDVEDISALVSYLRSIGKQKVVLIGHSTGCQDCMEYTSPVYKDNARVDGFILQGPVSDRDAVGMSMAASSLDESVKTAKDLIDAGNGWQRMPAQYLPQEFGGTPISASRWYALTAIDGEDNYFSPDLPDDVAKPYWSRIDKPILILHSDKEQYVPDSVDKIALVRRWMTFCRDGIASGLSGTIPGATHRVEGPESQEWLAQTVIKFLGTIA